MGNDSKEIEDFLIDCRSVARELITFDAL